MKNIISVLILSFSVWIILLMPFKIMSYGYLPRDDALRHTAKAVSGKPWSEILVLRDDVKIDCHAGWHAILEFLRKTFKMNAHSLVMFSVIFLFAVFSIIPILLMKRPEAWLISMLVMTVFYSPVISRLLLGRPYIFTMAAIAAVSLLWKGLEEKKIPHKTLLIITILVALSVWIHGGWYFYIFPLIAFLMARKFRALFRAGAAIFLGIILGALLTGHPYQFLKGTLQHVFLSFGNTEYPRLLVGEFQPMTGEFSIVVLIILVIMLRMILKKRDKAEASLSRDPIFILMCITWAGGFITRRVWIDIGMAATFSWIAMEVEHYLSLNMKQPSLRRVAYGMIISVILFLAITNDAFGRWSENRTTIYLDMKDREVVSWLPNEGGIIYSDSMQVFYEIFFRSPHASWRYVLGFEPGLMPKDDLVIYRDIQLKRGDPEAYEPWVKKMTAKDRIIIRRGSSEPPKIKGLEWKDLKNTIWIGRLPR